MTRADDTELIDTFEEFYRNYYRNEIGELAQQYPTEEKSLYVDWQDLYRFDPDLADDFRNKPEQLKEYAEEALRLYDLPVDVSLGQAHVRVENLPESTDIRDIRADHRGALISVKGIVRKATDVRPKITNAAFECQRCGTLTRIPQTDGDFQEPHECQGCERQGPFRINFDQSEFIDAQKLRIQESPEGLRGGETPQSIDINIEDDITGEVTAGDHVEVTGVLKLEQQGSDREKSAMFDVYMIGLAVSIEDEQFEDMDITDEDKKEIVELSNETGIYEKMVGAIAPSIYGYEKQKLAMILQLFSGVTKHLPDGSRIRGDLHMLLIGDPGTGKCLKGDTTVTLGDGRRREIREIVEENLDDPKPVDDGVYDTVDIPLPSLTDDGRIAERRATKVWKREAPDEMYRVRTSSGRELEVTPSHPLFVQSGGGFDAVRADQLEEGVSVAVAPDNLEVNKNLRRTLCTDGGSISVTSECIEAIEAVAPDYDWVYDLEVDGTHNYISNGVVSHNSAMLQYIRQIAPRSVYTSGKGASSAGLCVTGDTMVHTTEGFVPIRDLVTEHHPEPVSEETATEASYDLCTFDSDSGDLTESSSSLVWRMPEKPCRRVETAHGKELEATTETPLLVCGESGLEWRAVSDIESGDYVAVPNYDDVDRSSPSIRDFFEFTEEKLKPTDDSVEFLRQRLRAEFGTLRDAAAALDLSEDFIYDSLSNRHLPLDKLGRILDAIDANLRDIDTDRAMLRHGESVTIPDEFDEDLLYLVGLVFGDGDVMVSRRGENRGHVRISNSDETLLRTAADIIERKFGKSVHIEYQDDRVPCLRLHSATVARFFSNLGVESPKDDISLAPPLTTAEHADSFLRGLFDADGCVSAREDGGSSVQFSTICADFAQQIQLMLESYGIRAQRRERDRCDTYELEAGYEIESSSVQYHLTIYGRDIDIFADEIGFRSASKSKDLTQIVRDAPRRGERLPLGEVLVQTDGGGSKYYQNFTRGDNPSRTRAKRILDNRNLGDAADLVEEVADAELVWDEVRSVTDTGKKEVFDLTVPETHNFVGNGLVTHNTAAAVRDDFGEGQQWTLEAGALVLADQGIAAVDELDKMECVTGDTLVHTTDGIVPIRELALGADPSCEVEHTEMGRKIRGVDTTVWTMTDDDRLVAREVTAVHEYDAPSTLYEVTLESGESVTATADHPFFVLDDGQRVEKPAAQLSDSDWVYVPDSLPQPASDGGVVATAPDSEADSVSITPAHGAVLGYIAGDGNVYYNRTEGSYGIRFTNTEEELLADFERACRDAFDGTPVRHPSERRDDGVETVRLYGKEYVDALLDAGLNLETYDGKRVPEAVSRGSREVKAAFLRALADAEGNVDDRKVTIFSSSYELLLGAKMLLSEFGVTSQIQTREREQRDVYVLAITAADSLAAFERHVGFTLTRKQEALDAACERVSGDRTILDVLPDCGDLFEDVRESLRLHQSECGLTDATYCNFETGEANFSLSKAQIVLDRFETRRQQADLDLQTLAGECSWETLTTLTDRYHVPQREIADASAYSQQQVSRHWGGDDDLQAAVQQRLRDIVETATETDLTHLRNLVRGDVKWRRVSAVDTTDPEVDDGRVRVLRHRLAELLGTDETAVGERAEQLLASDPTVESWSQLRSELDRHDIPLQRVADRMDVAGSTVSRWVNGAVDGESLAAVRDVALGLVENKRDRIRQLTGELSDRTEPNVYDLTVDGTHNFLANGMLVHNSDDRSAMHEALEQQSYHPKTEVLLDDGRRVEIGEFVDSRMDDDPDSVVDGVDCEILPVDDVSIHTVDLDDNSVEKTAADRVSRHEAPEEFVRVTFSNGREVTVTPEHPMFVDDGGEVGTIEARNIEAGAFVPAPRKLPNSAAGVELADEPQLGKEKDIDLPETLSPELGEVLGLLVAEGHSYAGSAHEIGFSNQNQRLLDRMDRLMDSVFGMESTDTTNEAGTVTKRWVSTKLYRWFEENFPELMETARDKRIPATVLGASEEVIRRFLVGAFAGDGGVESEAMSFATASERLARDYADALSKIGVASRIHYSKTEDSWKTYVMGDSTERFVEKVVPEADDRHQKATAFVERSNRTARHHDVLPTSAAREIRSLRSLVGLRRTGKFRPNLDEGYGVQVDTVRDELTEIRDRIGDVRSALDDAERRLDALENRCDLRYYRVTEVETIPNEGDHACEWVYDVTVEPTNTFVSSGVVLHNSISVSKAGINATLKSRCSLLGAANPKYGRFDQYEPIGEQIDLEPALISRFDLIFTVTDQPDKEKDANLAEHIIQTNYAGELHTHRTETSTSNYTEEEVETVTEEVAPTVEPDLLRKYIAYAKRNCFPTMTEEAKAEIQDFYVNLRARGSDEDAAVPVTARKLEALVRLSEASARIRLSDTVDQEDAGRAVDIVRYCLEDIGMDPETGEFDADMVETGTSKSQRDRIKDLLSLIQNIEDEYDEGAPVDVVIERAEEAGMESSKAEHEIEQLKQKGEVYEPQTDHLRTT